MNTETTDRSRACRLLISSSPQGARETMTSRWTYALALLILTALLGVGLSPLQAAAKVVGGPKGGRILEKTEPRAEFLVEADRSVAINFYDQALKPQAVGEQVVTVVAEAPTGKTKLEFEKKGDRLVSTNKLPAGEDYNVVVQFKQSATAKPQNFRFKLDLSTCGECQRLEYACTCGH